MNTLVPFTFHGDALDVVRLPDGDVGIPLRRLCEVFGLDPEGQQQRLARASAIGLRWACTCAVQVQVGGQGREMLVLPRRSIPMWAATVDAFRVAEDVRAKLVAYQDDAAEALARAFLPGAGAPPPPAALPPGAAEDGARMHDLAAAALRSGDVDAARRYMGAAYMLTRAPRQPRSPALPRERRNGRAYIDTIRGRVLDALAKGPAPTMRSLRMRVMGRAEVITKAVDELAETGAVEVSSKGPRHPRSIRLAPVAAPGAEVH